MRKSNKAKKPSPSTRDDTTVTDIPATPEPTTEPTTDAVPYRTGARDARTIDALKYPYGSTSDRDDAYSAMLADAAGDASSVTLGAIHAKYYDAERKRSRNPFYTGASAKATDAGAIERQHKAGHVTLADDGRTVTFTDTGRTYCDARLKSLQP